MSQLKLILLPGRLAVAQLPHDAPIPRQKIPGEELFAYVSTSDEVSLVCAELDIPPGARVELGWRALKVAGPLDFALVGVLAGLAVPLSQAKISIFALSTYNTDYLLLKETSLISGVEALRGAGFQVEMG